MKVVKVKQEPEWHSMAYDLHLAGENNASIAELFGKTESTIKSTISRYRTGGRPHQKAANAHWVWDEEDEMFIRVPRKPRNIDMGPIATAAIAAVKIRQAARAFIRGVEKALA